MTRYQALPKEDYVSLQKEEEALFNELRAPIARREYIKINPTIESTLVKALIMRVISVTSSYEMAFKKAQLRLKALIQNSENNPKIPEKSVAAAYKIFGHLNKILALIKKLHEIIQTR